MNEQKHTMTGAWALNALDPGERARVEEYLAQDPEAAAEAHSFEETAGELARGLEPTAPRPELKDAVMSRITQTRQLPPLPAADHELVEEEQATEEPSTISLDRYRRSVRRTRWLAVAAAALMVTTVTGLGLWGAERAAHREAESTIVALQSQQTDSDQQRGVMSTILAADDAATLTLPSQTGGGVHLMYSVEQESMILSASGLRELPADSDYQLWLLDADGGARSVGLLPGPDATVTLEGSMEGITGLGVSEEPAGGSEQPSEAIVVLGEL